MKKKTIFDARWAGEPVSDNYHAVKIPLDGKMQSSLDWSAARQAALDYRAKGLHLLWEIDLGLFDRLSLPLSDQTQYLSLILSLEHFRDTLWKEFREETLGLCLYRGNADFSLSFPWDAEQTANLQGWLKESFQNLSELEKETGFRAASFTDIQPLDLLSSARAQELVSLFCRDVAGEYLDLMAGRLPDTLNCYLILDGSSVCSSLLLERLLTKERYPRLHVEVEKKENDGRELAFLTKNEKATWGICLPSLTLHRPSYYGNLEKALHDLRKFSTPYRAIPETLLTTEWDGLDFLLVVSRSISVQGRRKLQGFCAAGGTVVTLGDSLGLVNEMDFDEWTRLQKNR